MLILSLVSLAITILLLFSNIDNWGIISLILIIVSFITAKIQLKRAFKCEDECRFSFVCVSKKTAINICSAVIILNFFELSFIIFIYILHRIT